MKGSTSDMFYRRTLRPLLFSLDAEFAHERALEMLSAAGKLPFIASHQAFTNSRLRTTVAGIEFPNPVGLAAGCDKNARAIRVWPRFGFGFVETGTITAQPQTGNPRPRVFRIPEQQALVNRLGFNSEGSAVVASRLARLRRSGPLAAPLGINIGKTKIVSGDEATQEDYRTSYRRLEPYADFLVVNVSSPNTPGLREWQEKHKLRSLLCALMSEDSELLEASTRAAGTNSNHSSLAPPMETAISSQPATSRSMRKPIFLKISPDMADEDMDDVIEVALEVGIAGIIATNTTIGRGALAGSISETGGMSGRPLCERANEVMKYLYRNTKGRLVLLGVGGISSALDAYERIKSGASLVQFYTALVYQGPMLPRSINEGLLRLMERDGVKQIAELVGAGV
jgi:dihydroorotate dehydrogenase